MYTHVVFVMESVRSIADSCHLHFADDAAGPGGHNDDPIRQEHTFEYRVGDKDHRAPNPFLQGEQVVVQFEAGDFV